MYDEINREKKMHEKGIKIGIIITLAAFVLFIPVMATLGPLGIFIIVPPFFGGFIYAASCGGKVKQMSQKFKDKFLEEELSKIIPNSTYKMYDGFLEKEVVRSGLLRDQDRFHSEDMIVGEIEGVNFKCSDVLQEDVNSSKKGSSTTTVFRGRFYEFDFPKHFKSNVLIEQRALFNFFKSYKAVEMESVKFNSELQVYADNPIDAFYLLTPHFMERVLYLDKVYRDKIRFSFIENKLFIAVNSGIDYFDFKVHKTVTPEIFTEYKNEFEDIVGFVKILKLDHSIFKTN